MVDVSIICCFYDKDYTEINRIINQSSDISASHELILVDDRKNKSVNLNCENVITPYDGNKGLFFARRYGVEHATGKYIWLVDIDDDIHDFIYADYNTDVISYEYTCNANKYSKNIGLPKFFKIPESFSRKQAFVFYLFNGVWKNLYNREFLLNVYKDIPKYENFFMYEDYFLNACVSNHISSLAKDSQIIYNYHTKNRNFVDYKKEFLDMVDKLDEPAKSYAKRYFEIKEKITR